MNCGELFLVWWVRVTRITKLNSVGSDRRHYSGCDEGQLLEAVRRLEVTEFKFSRHLHRLNNRVRVLLGQSSDGHTNQALIHTTLWPRIWSFWQASETLFGFGSWTGNAVPCISFGLFSVRFGQCRFNATAVENASDVISDAIKAFMQPLM